MELTEEKAKLFHKVRSLFEMISEDPDTVEWIVGQLRYNGVYTTVQEVTDKLRTLISLEQRDIHGIISAEIQKDDEGNYYEYVYYVDPNGDTHDIIDIEPIDLVNADVALYGLYIIGFFALVADTLFLYWSKLQSL